MRKIIVIAIFLLILILYPVSVDASKKFRVFEGSSFETYLSSGSKGEQEELLLRIKTLSPSKVFTDKAKKIHLPSSSVLAVVASMSCPDCTAVIPYIYALKQLNNQLDIRFYTKTDDMSLLLLQMTKNNRVPTIMIVTSNGNRIGEAFIERPEKVRKLILQAKVEDVNAIVTDFRNGEYDSDIENDLLRILESAWN